MRPFWPVSRETNAFRSVTAPNRHAIGVYSFLYASACDGWGRVSRVAARGAAGGGRASPPRLRGVAGRKRVGGRGVLGALGALSKSTGQLKITVTNGIAREVTVDRFAVDLEGKVASIRDVGKFAPGITVDHGFKDFAGSTQFVFSRQLHPTCRVSYVKFADGSAWSLPDAPAELASPSPAPSP